MKKLSVLLLVLALAFAVTFSVVSAQEPLDEPSEEAAPEAAEETVEEIEAPAAEDVVAEEEAAPEAAEEAVDAPESVEGAIEDIPDFEDLGLDQMDGALEVAAAEISGTGAKDGAWSSTIYVSNPNGAAATGQIVYQGDQIANKDLNLPAYGSAAIDLSSVSGTYEGSAIVSSDSTLAVQVGLAVDSSIDRMLYTGFTQGASKVSMPSVVCNIFDQDSDFVVMNTGDAAASVNITYKKTGDADIVKSHSIPAQSSVYLSVCSEVGVASGWSGSATVQGGDSDSLVAVNFQPYVTAPKAVAYEALAGAGSEKVFFPTALQKRFAAEFTSFYAIQNVGDANTSVTLTVYNTDGSVLGTATQDLDAGAKWSVQPQHAGAGDAFSGSAVATAPGGEIAAITNIGTKPAGGSCPEGAGQTAAFLNPGNNASDSSSTLAIPWVEYKDGTDWRTFLAIQNVGDATSGNVSVMYYDANGNQVGSTDDLGTIGAGAKGGSNPSKVSTAGNFFGSVVIMSDNASDSLIALSNNQQADQCHSSSTLAIPVQ
jgi:hypothetical protein